MKDNKMPHRMADGSIVYIDLMKIDLAVLRDLSMVNPSILASATPELLLRISDSHKENSFDCLLKKQLELMDSLFGDIYLLKKENERLKAKIKKLKGAGK